MGSMLMDLCPFCVFDSAGQNSTQTRHPVQSSGATWMVYLAPFTSVDLKSRDLKVEGAVFRSSAG